MNSKLTTVLWVVLYAVLAGGSIVLYTIIDSFIKYLFSLVTLYIGIRFFRKFETIGVRIAFFVVAIVVYFIILLGYNLVDFIKSNPDLFPQG